MLLNFSKKPDAHDVEWVFIPAIEILEEILTKNGLPLWKAI
jgi:hypothetical protein